MTGCLQVPNLPNTEQDHGEPKDAKEKEKKGKHLSQKGHTGEHARDGQDDGRDLYNQGGCKIKRSMMDGPQRKQSGGDVVDPSIQDGECRWGRNTARRTCHTPQTPQKIWAPHGWPNDHNKVLVGRPWYRCDETQDTRRVSAPMKNRTSGWMRSASHPSVARQIPGKKP